MDIIECFPRTSKMKEPRPQQIEVLQWFAKGLSEGKRKFIICAPTGSGKSGIAKAIANYAAMQALPTLLTSPLNSLVEQYKEFESDEMFPLATLTGKRNYVCVAMREIKGEKQNCENGFCEAKVCSLEYGEALKTRKKVNVFTERDCENCNHPHKNKCPCTYCNYRLATREFKSSIIGNSNFTLLQMKVTNNPSIVIVDECDSMESFIRMFRKVTIDEYWKFPDFDDYVFCLEDKKGQYEETLKQLDVSLDTIRTRKRIKDKIDRIERLIEDITEHDEKYIVSEDNGQSTPFEPVNVARFIDNVLDTENRIVVLMSATPLKLAGWEFIEVQSPFRKEIRPFKPVPIGSMSMKNRFVTIPRLAKFLCDPNNGLLPGKTIVHVPSYYLAEELGRAIVLERTNRTHRPIIQTRSDVVEGLEGATIRSEVIERFKKSSDPLQILIAVNMGRGIDLPESDIKNNVITFIKRQNPTNHLVRAKWKYFGKEWEYEEAANEIMQQYGRVNRNDTKETLTVITEPEWTEFYMKHKKYFRNWFTEAII